jgi:hypothetical protein
MLTTFVDHSGSFRAAQYAATFPERVQSFALDAVIPHGRVCTQPS